MQRQPNAGPIAVPDDDEAMTAAIRAAKASIRQFLRAFKTPKPNQRDFHLKVRFEAGDACEHIWLTHLSLHTWPPTGVIANEPELEGLRLGQRVAFDKVDVSDWMYMEDGRMIGGFTTRVLLERQRSLQPGGRFKAIKGLMGRRSSIA